MFPYHVDDSVQKMVEEDFVAARAESERVRFHEKLINRKWLSIETRPETYGFPLLSQNMTVEDFERLLLLSRYVTLTQSPSNGGRLSADIWQTCKIMETERKARIPANAGRDADEARVGVEQ